MERDGKIAFVLRSNTPWMNGYYGLPSGKVEKKESFSECAVREIKEEVGVDVAKEDIEYVHTVHRHHENDKHGEWVDVYFWVTKWEGELYNAEPKVHSAIAWLDPTNLPENVIPSTKTAIRQITAGKKYSEYGFN
jgi:ADP-ribose pyrophosphatase YjhB (NUDIX family)